MRLTVHNYFGRDEEAFKESEHPRAKGGQFATGAGGGGAETSFSKKAEAQSLLSMKIKGSSSERNALRKMIKNLPKGDERTKLTHKLIESYHVKRHKLMAMGNHDEAAKVAMKIHKLAQQVPPPTPQESVKQLAEQGEAKSDAFKQAMQKNKVGTHLDPLHNAKMKVKSAAESGASLQTLSGELSGEEKMHLAQQYGSLQQAFQKSQEYAKKDAEQKQKESAEAAKLETEMSDPSVKKHYEVLKAITGSGPQSKEYIQRAEQKIKKAGLDKYITPAEGACITAYTNSHYKPLNRELRNGVMTETQWGYAMALNKALSKMPKYVGTVKRGASLDKVQVEKYVPGAIVPEIGFTSSGKQSAIWGDYTYTIHSKTGVDISKLSDHPQEGGGEVLFKHGTYFKVKSRSGYNIELEEMVHE